MVCEILAAVRDSQSAARQVLRTRSKTESSRSYSSSARASHPSVCRIGSVSALGGANRSAESIADGTDGSGGIRCRDGEKGSAAPLTSSASVRGEYGAEAATVKKGGCGRVI